MSDVWGVLVTVPLFVITVCVVLILDELKRRGG